MTPSSRVHGRSGVATALAGLVVALAACSGNAPSRRGVDGKASDSANSGASGDEALSSPIAHSSRSCRGEPTRCDDLESWDCERMRGCFTNDQQRCDGEAFPCEQYPEYECDEHPGCTAD